MFARKAVPWLLVLSGVALFIVGCGGGGLIARLVARFPQSGETVARNTAVWMRVRPFSSTVTAFSLLERVSGVFVEVPTDGFVDPDFNEFLFCPVNNLDANRRHRVIVELDNDRIIQWDFDTTTGFVGSSSDCYYIIDGVVHFLSEATGLRELKVRSAMAAGK